MSAPPPDDPTDDPPGTPPDTPPGSSREGLHLEVLETVADGLLALALWGGAAVLALTFLAQATGGWVLLLAPAVGILGAALNLRSRALRLRQRTRTGTTAPGGA